MIQNLAQIKQKYQDYRNGDPWQLRLNGSFTVGAHKKSNPNDSHDITMTHDNTADALDLALVVAAMMLFGIVCSLIRRLCRMF